MKINVFKLLELLVFFVITILSYYLGFIIKFANGLHVDHIRDFANLIPYIILIVIVVVAFNNYVSLIKKGMVETVVQTIIVVVLINVLTGMVAFLTKSYAFPRTVILLGFIIQLIAFSVFKLGFIQLLRKIRNPKKVMVITHDLEDHVFMNKVFLHLYNYDELTYIISDRSESISELYGQVDKFILSDRVDSKIKDQVITYCMGQNVTVYVVPTLFEIGITQPELSQIGNIPAFRFDSLELSSEKRFLKRLFDIVVSSIMILLTLPIMLVFGILVKLQDKGPIFYVQNRVTISGKEFKMLKFRTMIQDAEKETGVTLSATNDVRITKVGNFMRKHRVDELPQLFNVFLGEMSIVGPRPERPEFIDEFNDHVAGYNYRHKVKTGITGLAQIMGDYETSAENKLKYDLFYIRNQSILFDLQILLLTLKVMVLGLWYNYVDYNQNFFDNIDEKGYTYTLDNQIITLTRRTK